jgi:hypothetical protein
MNDVGHGVCFYRISRRWQQRVEPVAPGRLPRKPAAIPVEKEDIVSWESHRQDSLPSSRKHYQNEWEG